MGPADRRDRAVPPRVVGWPRRGAGDQPLGTIVGSSEVSNSQIHTGDLATSVRNDDRLASAASASSAWPGSLSLRSVRAADAGEAVPDRDADREVNPWSRESASQEGSECREAQRARSYPCITSAGIRHAQGLLHWIRRPRVSFGASGRELQCESQCGSATQKPG